jgi:hypothetical protein
MVSTTSYGDSFTFLYVDNFRTSQETHLKAFTACYEVNLIYFNIVYNNRLSRQLNGNCCFLVYGAVVSDCY